MIDMDKMDFYRAISTLAHSYKYSVNSVDWARAYVGANGKPSIRYRCGGRMRKINPSDEIVEFSNGELSKTYVDVNLDHLNGAIKYEAERIRHALTDFNGVALTNQRLVPNDDFVPHMRW